MESSRWLSRHSPAPVLQFLWPRKASFASTALSSTREASTGAQVKTCSRQKRRGGEGAGREGIGGKGRGWEVAKQHLAS